MDVEIGRNIITLLYQPLCIESEVLLSDDLVVDGLTFPAGTGLRNLYNFPFYRISSMREVLPNRPGAHFAWGVLSRSETPPFPFNPWTVVFFEQIAMSGLCPRLNFVAVRTMKGLVMAMCATGCISSR